MLDVLLTAIDHGRLGYSSILLLRESTMQKEGNVSFQPFHTVGTHRKWNFVRENLCQLILQMRIMYLA